MKSSLAPCLIDRQGGVLVDSGLWMCVLNAELLAWLHTEWKLFLHSPPELCDSDTNHRVCVCSCEVLECVKTMLQIQFPVTRLIVLTFWPQGFFLRDPRRVGVSRCVCCLQVHTCPYTLTAHHRRIHNHCCQVTKYIYSTPIFHFLLFYYNSEVNTLFIWQI